MITVFGSINLDLIGAVGRIPSPGETVAGERFATAPGGKGANQALAARRAGADVRLFGAVGDDSFGHEALALLDLGGVDLSRVRVVADAATGVAMIFVDPQGENVIAVLPGANGVLGALDAEPALTDLDKNDILIVQHEIPGEATRHALELASARGVTSILNISPFLETTPDIAPLASIVVANESEFALLVGKPPDEATMRDLARRTQQTIIATLGARGARAATPSAGFAAPALPIVALDAVGAGDTFVGYLAAGLDMGLALRPAMERASVAASLACLRRGAQPAIPNAAEVDAAAP